MGRSDSDYDYDYDYVYPDALALGATLRAIEGKRGQKALKEMAVAMDAMPVKRLCAEDLKNADGDFCALGVLASARGVDIDRLDAFDHNQVAAALNVAPSFASEVAFENDRGLQTWHWEVFEICGPLQPGQKRTWTVQVEFPNEYMGIKRWQHMRYWITQRIKK